MTNKKEELKAFIKKNAVKTGEFKLSSGGTSNFYIDSKQVTLNPKGLLLLAEVIYDMIKDLDVDAIGGMTIGADPIVAAVAVVSATKEKQIPAFIVRKHQKEHGMQKMIEGNLPAGSKVVIVDDVITKGTATLWAIEKAIEAGCKILNVISIVDRQEGGTEALKDYNFTPIFKKEDLI